MRFTHALYSVGLALCLSVPVVLAADKPTTDPLAETPEKTPVIEALSRKITVDYQKTPIFEVLEGLSKLANVKIEIAPELKNHPELLPPITLKIADATLANALNFACKLGGLRWEPDGNEIKCSPTTDTKAKLAKADGAQEPTPVPPPTPTPFDYLGNEKVRLKFSDGAEIEVAGPALAQIPELPQAVADLLEDPVRNGILAQKMPDEESWPEGVTLAKVKTLLGKAAPKATVEYDEDTRLLMVLSEDAKELRKAGAVLRALGLHHIEEPVPADDQGQDGAPPAKVRVQLPEPSKASILSRL